MKKYAAELLGTFALTFVVLMSLYSPTTILPTPLLAALTLMLFVYMIGHISGSHINPAVTIGQYVVGKISLGDGLFYIVAQLLGAVLAKTLAAAIIPSIGVAPAAPIQSLATIGEMLGTFFFTFGISAVVQGRVTQSLSGFVVGMSLLLGIGIAAMVGSAGILNPAVAFGVSSFTLPYIVGPIVGSLAGMVTYRLLDSGKGVFGKKAAKK